MIWNAGVSGSFFGAGTHQLHEMPDPGPGSRLMREFSPGTEVVPAMHLFRKMTAVATDGTKLDTVETNADVTDATNVNAAGAVMESDFDAQTILIAAADNTPTAVTFAASTFAGRKATGDVGAMTAAEARTVLNVEDGADVTDATNVDAAGATMNTDTDVSANSWVLDEDDLSSNSATKVATQQSIRAYSEHAVIDLVGGRLSLESGVSVSTSDQTAKTTIYYTPHIHDRIGLYNTTDAVWEPFTFTEASLVTTGFTASLPHDLFVYDNSGTLTLDAVAWTSVTARTTALAEQDDVKVKSGATNRRYVGTVYVNASKQANLDFDGGLCDVWNMYNRIEGSFVKFETTSTWTYTTDTYRAANGDSGNAIRVVSGLREDAIIIACSTETNNSHTSSTNRFVAIGENSTTAAATRSLIGFTDDINNFNMIIANLSAVPRLGQATYYWIERSGANGTTTWVGVGGGSNQRTGLISRWKY